MASTTAEVTVTLVADEYWEASQHDLAAQVAAWIESYYGKPCNDDCVICCKWKAHHNLFAVEPDSPSCTCGASTDPGSCGHHPNCPMKAIEG